MLINKFGRARASVGTGSARPPGPTKLVAFVDLAAFNSAHYL